MGSTRNIYDIAIAGGGPAGAVAAVLLARAGFHVCLATLLPDHERLEGLSPRVVTILQSHDLATDGIAQPSQRRASWGEFQGDQNVEHIVNRAVFDRSLLEQARQEGVVVQEGAISALLPETSTIRLRDGGVIRARLLFESRGRRAPRMVASAADHTKLIGPKTISVAGFLAEPSDGPIGSEIVAHPKGWTWRARPGDGRDWLQVVGDARVLRNVSGSQARIARLWQHVLGRDAAKFALPGKPVISATELRLNTPELDPRCPRLGDAAVALDPLSGHGLFWAISSALMALPMARTIFNGKTDLAAEFYRNRVIDTFWRQARIGRDFHAEAGQDGAFWQARSLWPDSNPAHANISAPRLEQRVLLRNGDLTRGEVLVTNADPGGAAFVLGQEIAPILRALGNRPLPDFPTFHTKYLPQQSARTAEGLHGWLINRGLGNGLAAQS